MRPRLILITGAPGTGKTTLAGLIGDQLPSPVLGKDAIKEGISLTEGARATHGGPIADRTFAALYGCIEVLLAKGCTVVAEGAFRREWFSGETDRFRSVAELRLVICRAPLKVARSRYRIRAESGDPRRLAHPDALVLDQMYSGVFPWSAYDLSDTDLPTLEVQTHGGYDPFVSDVLAFVRD